MGRAGLVWPCRSLGDGQQVAGHVNVQLNVAVFQLQQTAAHLQLLLEGPDELRSDLAHLQVAVLLSIMGGHRNWGGRAQGLSHCGAPHLLPP